MSDTDIKANVDTIRVPKWLVPLVALLIPSIGTYFVAHYRISEMEKRLDEKIKFDASLDTDICKRLTEHDRLQDRTLNNQDSLTREFRESLRRVEDAINEVKQDVKQLRTSKTTGVNLKIPTTVSEIR